MSSGEKNRWIFIVPTALVVMIVNVVVFILYMVIYGNFINPGQPQAFYEGHAQKAGPYSSIIAGIPLMYLAAKWLGTKFTPSNSIKAALLMWLTYFLIDGAIIALSGELMNILPLFIASFATKLGAAYLGGRAAHRSFS